MGFWNRREEEPPVEVWSGTLDGVFRCSVHRFYQFREQAYLLIEEGDQTIAKVEVGYSDDHFHYPLSEQINGWQRTAEWRVEKHRRWS